MATPLSATVGDAVLTYLQAQTYTQTIGTWARKAIPEIEITTMSGIYVTMQHIATEPETLDRTRTLAKLTYDIALQKKMAAGYSQSDVDALVALMEDEIGPWLDGNNDFNVTSNGQTVQVLTPDGPSSPVVYSPEDLRDNNLFTAVIRVQYQAIVKPPTANFTVSTVGLVTTLTSTSTGRITVSGWQISAGTVAPDLDATTITVTLEEPGSFTAILTVSGPYGESVKTQTITVA